MHTLDKKLIDDNPLVCNAVLAKLIGVDPAEVRMRRLRRSQPTNLKYKGLGEPKNERIQS